MKDETLSPLILTMLADLQQQVDTAPQAGSVYSRSRNGTTYLYAKLPVGGERVDRFLGKRGDPLAEANATSLRQGASLAKKRRTVVAMLRRAGLAGPDRMLGAALDAIAFAGLFRSGAVLVGTAAYMMLEPFVGRRLSAPTLMTADLDLATAQVALAADESEKMEEVLKRVDDSYEGIPQLDPGEPSSRFRNSAGHVVDLLTPVRSRTDRNPVRLRALGAGAAPLQYLAWLIDEPLSTVALWGAGIPVMIPQPAKFAVHKLILAQRRDSGNRLKRRKDLDQARDLIEALLDHDRHALGDRLDEASKQGRDGWATPIARSLDELGMKGLAKSLK